MSDSYVLFHELYRFHSLEIPKYANDIQSKSFFSIHLTVEYEPLPISLINLKSWMCFFGIDDGVELSAIKS